MKMQLSLITATNIANSRPSYSTPQQRQGAIVDESVRDLIKSNVSTLVQAAKAAKAAKNIALKDEKIKLAKALNEVLRGMKRASDDLTIKAEKTGKLWNFSISPRNSKSPGNSKYSYIVGEGGQAILEMFNRMLQDLQSI